MPYQFTRRSFLGKAALLASAGAVPMLSGFRPGSTQTAPTLRLGLLTPTTDTHSTVRQLRAGLELGFARSGTRVTLLEETVGPGPASAIAKAERLVRDEEVDLVAGVLNPVVAAELGPLCAKSGTCLMVMDTGANAVRAGEQNPWVFYNSLGLWRASWSLGAWTARKLGKRAFVAGACLEMGYDLPDAFQLGLESAGGEVVGTSITHIPGTPTDWQAVMTAIESANPDAVCALYGGAEAAEFSRAYAAAGLAGRIPLVSPLTALEHATYAFSWAPSLGSSANRDFMAAFAEATGERPGAFALLGYETAQLVARAGVNGKGGMPSRLTRSKLESPRGWVRMSAGTHATLSPLYLLKDGTVTALDPAGELSASPQPLRASMRTGWLNPYLSI